MNLKDIVSISGMGGLYQVRGQRSNGLIVSALGEEKSKFVSNRVHMFTPLEGITIYTYTDNVELGKVLLAMKKIADATPPLASKESNDAHKEYFKTVLPDFDEDRVYVSDIKKLIKWYHALDGHGLIVEEPKAKKKAKKAKAEETAEDDAPAEDQ